MIENLTKKNLFDCTSPIDWFYKMVSILNNTAVRNDIQFYYKCFFYTDICEAVTISIPFHFIVVFFKLCFAYPLF